MKTKTRVLAMLLTVLMVVGILPLSLFALDDQIPASQSAAGTYVSRTQQEIQAEFDRVGMELSSYQSFNSLTPDSFAALHDANNFVTLGADQNDVQNGGNAFVVINRGNVYSIVGDSDKALYYSKDAVVEGESYLEITAGYVYNESIYANVYFSADIKMEGDTMPVAGSSILGVHIRPNNKPRVIPTLKYTANGELYVGEYSEENVIGQLSKTEYTRVAIAIDREANKFFVYINDVLANLGGTTLFSQANVDDYNSTASASLTAQQIPINSFRSLVINNNEGVDGFFLDNLIFGKIWNTTGRDTEESLKIQSDFSTATAGEYPFSGNAAKASFGTGYNYVAGGNVCTGAIVYIDEDEDGKADAIKYQVPTENIDNTQAYVQYQGFGGQYNMSVSFDVKLGKDGWVDTDLIWHDIGKSTRIQKSVLKLGTDGKVRTATTSSLVGALSQDKYTNVRVDIIVDANSGSGLYLYFLDNVLKAVDVTTESPDDILHFRTFRIYTIFSGQYAKLKENDLQLKNIKFAHTSAYNNITEEIPFATNPTGFIKRGNITRYYNADGSYITKDFFIGSTKYLVGEDGAVLSKVSAPLAQRSLDDIKKAFADQNINLVSYQTFQNWEMEGDTFAFTENSAPGGDSRENLGAYAEYASAGYEIKNNRNSYYIKKDADGNKALFFNHSEKPSASTDNFIDMFHGVADSYTNQQGNASHDYYVSFDLKMNGVNVLANSLLSMIYRPEAYGGANGRVILSLTAAGGIVIGGIEQQGDYGPNGLVGFLSQEEYTRIAVATDRANNKFYVYINDVLVNPEGSDLFTQFEVDRMNKTNTRNDVVYTKNNIPVCNFRVYASTEHNNSDAHKGLFFDNFLVGNRFAVNSNTTEVKTVGYDFAALGQDITIDNPNAELGKAGLAIDPELLVYGAEVIGINDNGEGTIRWVDENGDGKADAAEWHWSNALGLDPKTAQAYFNLDNPASATTNLRVSIDVKAGQTGTKSTTLFYLRNGSTFPTKVTIDGSGNLKLGNAVIGTLSKNKYTNVTLDYVRNTVDGKYAWTMVFVDGIFAGYQRLTVDQNFKIGFIRVPEIYNDSTDSGGNYVANVSAVSEQDIRVKAVSLGSINDYDGFARMSPFENVLTGFYGVGGIVRYYNGDSTFKTEDFTLDGDKFIVNEMGNVIGREAAGVVFAPYAPYVDWAHTGTMLHDKPDGSLINVDGSPIKYERDAFYNRGTDDGKPVYIYQSFYDTEPGTSPNDHTSYTNINFSNGLKNTSAVIDLDIKLSDSLVNKANSGQAFIYLRGQETSTNGGGRKDYDFNELFLHGDGWLVYNGKKVAKLSNTEYSRMSVVVHGPQLDSGDNLTAASSIDIYVNGVLVVSGLRNPSGAKYLQQVRFFKMNDCDFTAYFKNTYMYNGDKPQQFYTMQAGSPVLTSDASKTPATPADLKQGFVAENGVIRYYDELGLPVIDANFTYGGKSYYADENGVVPMPCVGDTHLGMTDNGECSICGAKADGVSSLYGNSLVLGSDVKVVFYLDLIAEKAKAVEIGIAGRDVKTYALGELETVAMGGKTLYKVEYAVSGKDICTEITVSVVKADDTYANSYTYSAAQYAADVQLIETDEVYTAELKALANALLVYGKTAAAVLADGEAYEVTDEVSFENVSDATGTPDQIAMAVKLNKFTLELKSNIKFKVYFTIDAEAALLMGIVPEDYVATVNEIEVDFTEVGEGLYCIELEILAADLGKTLNIAIKDTLNGFGIDLSICPLYYAKIVASSDSMDADYKNLAKAIKLYADAAVAYANEIAEDSRPAL